MSTSAYYLLRINSRTIDSVSVIQLSDDEWCNLRYVIDTMNTQQIYISNGVFNPNRLLLSVLSFETKEEAKSFMDAMYIDDIKWFESYEKEEEC